MAINIKSCDRICIFGLSGSGKTYITKKLFWDRFKRSVFIDTKNESVDLLNKSTYLARTPEEFLTLLNRGALKVLYQGNNELDDWNDVAEICYKMGNITVFCDESSHLTTATQIEPYHKEIMQRGRSKGVGILNCSQRPVGCHNSLVSEAQHFFIFRLVLKSDLDKLRGMLKPDLIEAISNLKEYHYVYANIYGDGVVCTPI